VLRAIQDLLSSNDKQADGAGSSNRGMSQEWIFGTNTGSDLGRRAGELGCLKAGNFNCSDDDPEHDKQSAEEEEPSDDSLDSALPSGRSVSPRHELPSGLGMLEETRWESASSIDEAR
jgi:hypothetical protein